ncbi:MAG: 5-carboxymethyl-2-hydroxymuconate isomerase [Rhodospirillaceae bacterium]|nr:5-carboxymethyl-2-hydroxymuconate isomerase [Rhodospirillaceae bacterium]|tara:strand:- start:2324 stop:3172 length:849 start_codon:yes stop_codon:yes gene_type:complete
MRFASFVVNGADTWGIATEDGLISVQDKTLSNHPTLRSAIASGKLTEIHDELTGKIPDVSHEQATFLPVITDPEKILCVGLNYHEHRLEGGHGEVSNPTIFVRFANAQIGHNQPMLKPRESDTLDFEAELAVIIGRGGRRIDEKDALSHIAGYSCYNDGSVREFQRHTTQFTPGKNFMATGGFGPWMVTPDEIVDLQNVTVESRLNGQIMQHAKVADMIFPIPRLISYISTFSELVPGDVIATGTPGGVGSRRDPQVWMFPGDVCEIEISSVGTLVNSIREG